MSEPSSIWGPGVRMSAPRMTELQFSYTGPSEITEGTQIEYDWGLGVYRFSELRIGIEFTVAIRVAELVGHTTYRIGFELVGGTAEASDPDRALRTLAARVAPTTLFPYIRETFSSAALRCGLNLVLPFQTVGALYSPEEIELPPAPVEEEGTVSNPVTNAAGEG